MKRAGLSVALLLAGLTLTACGGSSKGTSSSVAHPTTSSAQTTTSTPTATASKKTRPTRKAGPSVSRSAPSDGAKVKQALGAFSACMKAHGAGGAKPGTEAYTAAAKSCAPSLTSALAQLRGHTGEPSKSAAVKPRPAAPRVQLPPKLAGALQKFAACMRENGVTNFPEPHGATFDTSHLNTSSAQFKSAETKCNAVLQGAF
jgi:hypothetical protein